MDYLSARKSFSKYLFMMLLAVYSSVSWSSQNSDTSSQIECKIVLGGSHVARKTFDLNAFRESELRQLDIDLAASVATLYSFKKDLDPAKVTSFLNKKNPQWTQNEIQTEIKKRTGTLGRAFAIMTSLRGRNESPADQHLILEFLLQDEKAHWSNLPHDVKNKLFKATWQIGSQTYNSLIRILLKAESLSEIVEIVTQYLHHQNETLSFKAANLPAIADQAISFLKFNPAKLRQVFELAVIEENHTPIAKELINKILQQKLLTNHDYLKSLDRLGLSILDRKTWSQLLDNSIAQKVADAEALTIYQRWFDHLLKENFRDAFEWNRKLTAYQIISTELSAKNYISLLTQSSSDSARKIILEYICALGSDSIKLYVGQDIGARSRLEKLFVLQPSNAQAQENLKSYLLNKADEADQIGDTATVKDIKKKYPDHTTKKAIEASKGLYDRDFLSELVDVPLKAAIENQDQVNGLLHRVLDTVVKANAPPKAFAKKARPLTAYLLSVPLAVRASHVTQLLEANSSSTANLALFIAGLDPIPGVPVAVSQFLSSHRFFRSNRTDFSSEEVLQMFGGARFKAFFPHVQNATLEGPIRTRFILAVRLDPRYNSTALNLGWLSEKLDDAGVRAGIPAVYGFRPALQYSRLATQLEEGLDGEVTAAPPQQARGLIVQGYYEKQGHSLMNRLATRGQDHVEDSAPALANAIENSLVSGILATQPSLIQNLFVKNWLISSDLTLIESIRSRAIKIASMQASFWDLRVELHNFPTSETLNRVKAFRDQATSSAVVTEIDKIIKELESFLRLGNSSAGIRDTVSKSLKLPDDDKAKLIAMTANFDQENELGKLNGLLDIRKEFKAMKSASSSDKKMTEKINGQNLLSEAGIAVANRFVENLDKASFHDRTQMVYLILQHMILDGFVTAKEATAWIKSLTAISQDASLSRIDRLNFTNRILNSIVDRTYYTLMDNFGMADNSIFQTVKLSRPIRFIDATLRSGFVFLLSKIVDFQDREIAQSLNIQHKINEKSISNFVQIHNKGDAVGILRLNKNPLELSSSEIAVFNEIPAECGPVAGIISVGVGARLSHLQLLAKSLKIPNVQVSREIIPSLQELDGQMVRLRASAAGVVVIEKVERENGLAKLGATKKVKVPFVNHEISTPINFADLKTPLKGAYAGPKGVTLAKLFQSHQFKGQVPDGVILPFGFFNRYAEKTGLQPLLEALSKVKLENKYLIGFITAQIQLKIQSTPVPNDMMQEVLSSVTALNQRTGNKNGNFFRSDTNVEDLPEFNGAGLNDSVPNVSFDEAKMNQAIRTVWISPLTEKSIYWRGLALGRSLVTVAEPSVVIMPTVSAVSSGVMITRGGVNWNMGQGVLSANYGIGSVVQAERPVEEYSFEKGALHKLSWSASTAAPKVRSNGGLSYLPVQPGSDVLDNDTALRLNNLGVQVEQLLGPQQFGWDIEWAVDENNNLIILQARPNM